MNYTVRYAPEAASQLARLEQYLSQVASPDIAAHFVDDLVDYCDGLGMFPHRGQRRDDIRAGLRITAYRKRTLIALTVDEDAQEVIVVGIFHGGQDIDAALRDEV